MSSPPNVDVEILKLARLVACDPQELGYLRDVDPHDVRDLREQVTVVMFDGDRRMFQRVALAARLVPTRLVALIAQRAFGPLLCARVTGLLEPSRAVDVAARLPAPFLAELAVALDPRRASDVIARIPPEQVADVTTVLARRAEYVTMGSFVGHLSDAALRAAIAVLGDEELLRTAYFVESDGSLGALVAMLEPTRLEMVLAAATAADLWIEALDVLGRLGERQRGQLADVVAGQPDVVLDGMVRAAQRELLWDPLMRFAIGLEQGAGARVAGLLAGSADDVLDALLDVVWEQRLEPELAHLASLLRADELRAFAERLVTRGGEDFVAALREAAHELELHELGKELA